MVIWIIGLAGAGKTVVGRLVYEALKTERPNTVFLDGDHLRAIMGEDLGHTLEDRRRNGWRLARLCQFLDSQGIQVVCSVLSLFHDQQDWNRATHSHYFEVFLDVPFEELERRDQKNLYSGARAGRIPNVAGIDIPFIAPPQADLTLSWRPGPGNTPADQAAAILDSLKRSRPN